VAPGGSRLVGGSGRRSLDSRGGKMLEITTQEVAFTAEGTLLEVLRIVDVKDSTAPVRLRVREWIDERHYRDVNVSEDPIPDFIPEWLAA
jgi:hypothetical protein